MRFETAPDMAMKLMLQALEQRKPMIQPEEQLLLSTASEFDDFFNTRGYHRLASVDFWQV